MAQWMQCNFIQTSPTWADAVCSIVPDTHDGGHWKRRKDAKYGDESLGKESESRKARRAAIDAAFGTVLPKPAVEPQAVPQAVVAKPAVRAPVQKSKGITPTEPDAIDLRMKQMEDDERIVMFIASQLH